MTTLSNRNKYRGEQIRILRYQKKYTQEEIANKLNISQNAYWKIENGETTLSIEHLLSLSKVFELQLINLIELLNHES